MNAADDHPHALIPLTRGKVAIVDLDDLHAVGRKKWYAEPCGNRYKGHSYRAVREVKGHKVFLHREVMGQEPGGEIRVRHLDGNCLDCRRENLEISDEAGVFASDNPTAKKGEVT